MSFRSFRNFLALTFLFCGILLGACVKTTFAGEAWEQALKRGTLRWCADTSGGAPYVFQDAQNPTRLVGFELDVMEALALSLGLTAQLVDIPWDQLVPSLLRGDCDIAFNGLEITPEREQTITFTNPYYVFSEQITIRKGGPRLKNLDDLRGRRVGTLSASLAHTMMSRHGRIEIVPYPGPVEPYKDLQIGRLDAVLLDVPIAAFYAAGNPQLENLPSLIGEGFYAGGVRRDSPVLLGKVNNSLNHLWASNEMEKIYVKWNLWNGRQQKLLKKTKNQDEKTNPFSLAKFFPLLLNGAGITVLVSTLSMLVAVLLGFALCSGKLYGNKLTRWLCSGYVEIIRGTPLLIQLYLLYYGLPNLGIQLNAFTAAVLGLGMNYAACESEIYRAGLLSIARGQTEAARSLGMSGWQTLFHVTLPQAVKTILPPSTNDFIALFKDSSLVSIITVVELTKMYSQAATGTFRFLELGLVTAGLYFAMSYPLALLSRRLEEKERLHHA